MAEPAKSKILWILGGATLLLSLIFAGVTIQTRRNFDDYKVTTLSEGATLWSSRALSVDECVGAVIDWTLECPSIQSWCLGSMPGLLHECLQSQPRTASCKAYGGLVDKTAFGFEECAARYEPVEGKYLRRATKKYCAAAYRSVADFCADDAS